MLSRKQRSLPMSMPTSSKTSDATPVTTSTEASPATRDRLATGDGQISVAEGVVQKIAGKACREVSGVHSMGSGPARAFGALRERIPGSSGANVAQGVGVEVGETEAAIDLDIVVEYGVGIAELGRSIQRNVKQSVERMTGPRVVEVNRPHGACRPGRRALACVVPLGRQNPLERTGHQGVVGHPDHRRRNRARLRA
jgi:uncharacterized alkaline shock family protein YloU